MTVKDESNDTLVSVKQVRDVLNVYWVLTDYCNFSCPYCPRNLHDGDFFSGRKPGWPSEAQIQAFIPRLLAQANGTPINITLSGGEPTTHPSFKWLAENPDILPVSVVTNCSRPLAWWKSLSRLPRTVVVSLHPKFSNVTKINEVVTWLTDKGVDTYLNLLLDPFMWEKSLSIFEGLNPELRKSVRPKVINYQGESEYQGKDNSYFGKVLPYTKEQRDFIASFPTVAKPVDEYFLANATKADGSVIPVIAPEFIRTGNNAYKGWKCSAGSKGITVSFDGNVYAGICLAKNLGTLESFELEKEFLTCPKYLCACPGDLVLTKVKS